MQLILETESIDINTKMSEINVQAHLDTKPLPNGIVDSIKIVNKEHKNKEEIIEIAECETAFEENYSKSNNVNNDISSNEEQINATVTEDLSIVEKGEVDKIEAKSNENGNNVNDDISSNEEQINATVTEDVSIVEKGEVDKIDAKSNENGNNANGNDAINTNSTETLTEKTDIDTCSEYVNQEEATKKIDSECNFEKKENGYDNSNDASEAAVLENNTNNIEENKNNISETHDLVESLVEPKTLLNNIDIDGPAHNNTASEIDNEPLISTVSLTEKVETMEMELTNNIESKSDEDNMQHKEDVSTYDTKNQELLEIDNKSLTSITNKIDIVDSSFEPITTESESEHNRTENNEINRSEDNVCQNTVETSLRSHAAVLNETENNSNDVKSVETVSNTEKKIVTENKNIEETTVDDTKELITEEETITTNKNSNIPEISESMDVDEEPNITNSNGNADLKQININDVVTDTVSVEKDEEPDITNSNGNGDPKQININDVVTDTVSVEKDFQENTVKPANDHASVESPEQIDSSDDCMEVTEVSKETLDEPKKVTTSEVTETNVATENFDSTAIVKVTERKRSVSGLSNSLHILSDDEEDEPDKSEKKQEQSDFTNESEDKCINIDDDDDIMLIDDDTSSKQEIGKTESPAVEEIKEEAVKDEEIKVGEGGAEAIETVKLDVKDQSDSTVDNTPKKEERDVKKQEVDVKDEKPAKVEERKPIVPPNFLKTYKTNVADMTREELEEFCLVKIVEGVIDRSNLSEIKAKLKTMSQSMDEWRKKSMMLTKQNRDLQIVLKTVNEEQKKRTDMPITPLKITRSVGMQVFMSDLSNDRAPKRKVPFNANNRAGRPPVNPSPRPAKAAPPTPPACAKLQQIPVPRLVPATNNSPSKNSKTTTSQVQSSTVSSNSEKTSSPMHNGVKNTTPVKPVEKRPFSSVQSVTVDLTDDEPPSKQLVTPRNAPQAPVRLVAQQQLLTARGQMQNQSNLSGPRKVYIPINQNANIRPGQTIMLKSVPPPPRPRGHPPMVRLPHNSGPIRIARNQPLRHPAPLPDVAKQSQPPNWKALPPAPDLKISKVENGIVISWKIEGYQEDSYEEIASYQLYAYQETSSPPSTMLWKKIGDVKALPLPMACTLTQFMAGYKYFFAVRAVDVRSRIGPFSLPGSILLLNK